MDKERLTINSILKRARMCGPFLLSYAASWSGAASVVFRTAGDHARMPRVRLLVGCAVRRLPVSWDAPRHAPLGCLLDGCGVCPLPDGGGRMSGSARRAPCPSLPVCGTSRASAASGMAWHGRQGTTGPGDALMVGIPAARLCF